jgi:DNA-binding NarL/FixJ family response regulator
VALTNSTVTRTAVLLDAHPVWLDAVQDILTRVNVTVVGKATAPAVALTLIDEHKPDLFVIEIDTRGDDVDGIQCMRAAKQTRPDLRMLVLSSLDDTARIEAAFTAGATAYVIKTAHSEDVGAAVRQAFEPSVFLANGQGRNHPSSGREDTSGNGDGASESESKPLTRRELEILQLVSEGYSNAELARMLWVAEQTVKFHLSNIYRKLAVANRTEASRWAQLHNILPRAPGRKHVSRV